MKRITYTFFLGILCALSSMGQPFDVVLNTAQQGNVTVQARNSIKLAAGYSYTPNGGTFLTQIVNPVVIGNVAYDTTKITSTYSINPDLAVGKTHGELNVSGMAGYTVPIDLPKGSAGLQPNLSLNYMSSFNDGLMGIGWNMGGLSTIHRVNQNLYFETQSNPIKGDLTDKYAMDGKRLIVTSGTYGTDLSVYGTELEEFSKIIAHGATGQGPAWFEVRTKSGLICEYGNTSDSKVLRDGTCVLIWKVNKISDRYGNCITFSYFESDDERPILKILYAGTTSTFAEINFRYKQRSDISTYVNGGKEFTRDILLDNIEVKNNGQIYKRYDLAYMLDNYAQLQKITKYSSQNQPLNPLVFTYTDQAKLYSYPTHYSSPVTERFFNGDFNGDGYIDFVMVPAKTTYTTSDKWKLFLGSANGQMVTTQAEGNLDTNFKDFKAADIDGDGLTDLIKLTYIDMLDEFYQYKYSLSLWKSTGNGFLFSPPCVSNIKTYWNFDLIDYNGDRKLEILIRNPYKDRPVPCNYTPQSGEGYVWKDSNTGICYIAGYPAGYKLYDISGNLISSDNIDLCGDYVAENMPVPGSGSNQIIDFNGDGYSDILVLFSNSYKLYEFKGTNNKLTQTSGGINLKNCHSMLLGDFNGDGLTDIVRAGGPVHSGWSMLSWTKDGFIDHPINSFSNFDLYLNNNRWNSCDINGDGKTDIILWGKGQDTNNGNNRINVAINKGNGYEYNLVEYISPVNFNIGYKTTTPYLTWEDYEKTSFFYFGDYNGDGRDDFFYKDNSGNSKLFSFATGTPGNLLRSVFDGFGTETVIIYKPMSNTSVFTRGSGAQYPLCDFSSGMQLVSGVYTFSDSQHSPTFSTTYKYEGAKHHLKGKGFLGFTKTTRTNVETELFTESNYSFDSPYYYPKLNTSYTKRFSTTISTVVNTWDVSTFTESNRVFPYIKSSTQTDHLKNLSDTSSVEYPQSNLYGNPISITKSYSSGQSKKTSFWYNDERVSEWLIGRPTTITETSTSGSDSQSFNISRSYFSSNNSPDVDQYNSGDESYWQLNRDYDAFGNLWKEHKATTGLTETHTIYDYDNIGVNLMKVTDPLLNQTNYTWYTTTGLINTQTDPFGNVVTYNYNTFDQLSSIVPTTGISTSITSSFNVSGGPTNARYYVDKTGTDGSQTKVWYDKLSRELRTETRKFGGTLVKVDKQYNLKGELAQYSEPTTGTASSWNVVGHDNYGRVNSLDPIFGPTTTYSEPYGNPTITRIVNGRNYKTTENAAGWVTSTEDPGGTITNSYWPNGLLKSTLTPWGVTTSMTYNKNGNRLTISDPSAGNITNTWYGTGQPKTTANAYGQTTYTYTPDSKVLLQNCASPEGTTNYTYYANGL